jgi:hypothetical protein
MATESIHKHCIRGEPVTGDSPVGRKWSCVSPGASPLNLTIQDSRLNGCRRCTCEKQIRMSAPGLFDWPRTRDEDIHEPPGALLPIRAGGHVSDADKSLK